MILANVPGKSLRYAAMCALLTSGLTCGCAIKDSTAPEPSKLSKAIEMLDAKGGPSASEIGGNPRKWARHYVKLDCEIMSVSSDNDEADAECGKGVAPVKLVTPQPDLDYADTNAVNEAVARAQRQGEQIRREAEDLALVELVGEKVREFDGNQRVTIVGPVLGSGDDDDARIRIDYAQ